MIVNITQSHISAAQLAFLQCLGSDDIIICRADGVYVYNEIKKSVVAPQCLALIDDCLARGVSNSQTVSVPELVKLQVNQQQWINL